MDHKYLYVFYIFLNLYTSVKTLYWQLMYNVLPHSISNLLKFYIWSFSLAFLVVFRFFLIDCYRNSVKYDNFFYSNFRILNLPHRRSFFLLITNIHFNISFIYNTSQLYWIVIFTEVVYNCFCNSYNFSPKLFN